MFCGFRSGMAVKITKSNLSIAAEISRFRSQIPTITTHSSGNARNATRRTLLNILVEEQPLSIHLAQIQRRNTRLKRYLHGGPLEAGNKALFANRRLLRPSSQPRMPARQKNTRSSDLVCVAGLARVFFATVSGEKARDRFKRTPNFLPRTRYHQLYLQEMVSNKTLVSEFWHLWASP